jgi:hypothetical protein
VPTSKNIKNRNKIDPRSPELLDAIRTALISNFPNRNGNVSPDRVEEAWVSHNELRKTLKKGTKYGGISHEALRDFMNPQKIKHYEDRTIHGLSLIALGMTPDEWEKGNLNTTNSREFIVDRSSLKFPRIQDQFDCIAVYPRYNPIDIGVRLAKTAQVEILFYGLTHDTLLNNCYQDLLGALTRGISLKFMFLAHDNSSERIEDISKSLGCDTHRLQSECEVTIQAYIDLLKKWQNKPSYKPEQLQAKTVKYAPRMRLYVADPNHTSGETFFIPSICHRKASDIPMFYYRHSNETYRSFIKGFNISWNDKDSIYIQETLEKHRIPLLNNNEDILQRYPIPDDSYSS